MKPLFLGFVHSVVTGSIEILKIAHYQFWKVWINFGTLIVMVFSQALSNELQISRTTSSLLELNSPTPLPQNHFLKIISSSDLLNWKPIWQFELAPRKFKFQPARQNQIFRWQILEKDNTTDWSNQINPNTSQFYAMLNSDPNSPLNFPFLKFTIELHSSPTIWYQDTLKHPFHYTFARLRIPNVQSMGPQEYAFKSLYNENQEYALGSIFQSPDESIREIGIQFSGLESFKSERVIEWIQLVQSNLVNPDDRPIIYFPSSEQLDQVEEDKDLFLNNRIIIDRLSRWIRQGICYSQGWTIGKLKYIPSQNIKDEYLNGNLDYSDILLTDDLPSEIPSVAGIITLNPASPNSHSLLLAQASGTPASFVSNQIIKDQLRQLDGRWVFYVVDSPCNSQFKDVTNLLSLEQIQNLLKTKLGPPIEIEPIRNRSAIIVKLDALSEEKIWHVGGKATQFQTLLRSIPESAPNLVKALSFDLWVDHLNQPFRNTDKTLRQAIEEELVGYSFPPDPAELHKSLYFIKKWIRETPLSQYARDQIIDGLGDFETLRKIRFRSSTNIEDTDKLNAAGLYDSFSGCLADDLDGDERGPSRCDPFEEKERGVFRAIKKVLASFYNDRAFTERLRYGIDEKSAGMAILVHYSFPDEKELANGVIVSDFIQDTGSWTMKSLHTTQQLGALSITNPDNSHIPEVMLWNEGESWTLQQSSNLVETNDNVMTFPDDYNKLRQLVLRAAQTFIEFNDIEESVSLDLEFKKMNEKGLVIKQIRIVPKPFRAPVPDI